MNKKRVIATLAACGLVGVLAIGGTMAYLTSTQSATNTFTVGKVNVELNEPNFPGVDEDDEDPSDPEVDPNKDTDDNGIPDINEHQVPNQETNKDPKLTNTGVSDSVVFFKVTVPVREFTHVASDGTVGEKSRDELYYFKQGYRASQHSPEGLNYEFSAKNTVSTTITNDVVTDVANHWNDDFWVELPEEEEGADHSGEFRTYVFGYKYRLHGTKSVVENTYPGASVSTDNTIGETTVPLFTKVQLKNFLEGEIPSGEIENITVQAYAIQADNVLADGAVIGTTGEISKDNLGKIYKAYVTQNKDITNSNDGKASNNAGSGMTDINNIEELDSINAQQ